MLDHDTCLAYNSSLLCGRKGAVQHQCRGKLKLLSWSVLSLDYVKTLMESFPVWSHGINMKHVIAFSDSHVEGIMVCVALEKRIKQSIHARKIPSPFTTPVDKKTKRDEVRLRSPSFASPLEKSKPKRKTKRSSSLPPRIEISPVNVRQTFASAVQKYYVEEQNVSYKFRKEFKNLIDPTSKRKRLDMAIVNTLHYNNGGKDASCYDIANLFSGMLNR